MTVFLSAMITWFLISLILMVMEARGVIKIDRPYEPVFFCLAAAAYVPAVIVTAAAFGYKRVYDAASGAIRDILFTIRRKRKERSMFR